MGADVRVIVDAAQAVAHVPIDVVKLGIDALVLVVTNFMVRPERCSVDRRWRRDLVPSMVGGGAIDSYPIDYELAGGVRGFELDAQRTGCVGLARAIEWVESVSWETIQLKNAFVITCKENCQILGFI